ncbi:unnamed protein product, partial [Didymodactylos carnosus]
MLWKKRKIQPEPLKISILFATKCISASLYILVQILRVMYYFLPSRSITQEQGFVTFITPILVIITVLHGLWLMNNERTKGMFCSGLLFSFWLLSTVAIIPDLVIYTIEFKRDRFLLKELARVWIQFSLSLLLFIANCFAEPHDFRKTSGKNICPELYVSFPSRITFWWVTKVVIRGYKRPLIEDDCWDLHLSEKAVNVVEKLQYYWNRKLLNFIHNPSQPVWLGIFYACLLGLVVFAQTLFSQASFHRQFVVGLRFRSAITGIVYRKSLKLSNSSKQTTTTGEIVNLMTIDAQCFQQLAFHIHDLWSGPVQITLALYLLYNLMGYSIIPGVVLLLSMIPINILMQRMQKTLMVLKLYAWEPAFIHRISDIREKELLCIRKKAIVGAISALIGTFTPILICITTFAVYVLSNKNNVLDPSIAFVAVSLLHLLRVPLVALPGIIANIADALVSDERISKFLSNEEIDEEAVQRVSCSDDENVIRIENGSFLWTSNEQRGLILKNINMCIRKGSLCAIVGSVGSGKSSILSSILGEMNKVEGQVIVNGRVAYVPQHAWIMNSTLRENILFGKDLNDKEYMQVIDSCALKQDLDMLPHGDQTEIGEK